MVSLPRVGGVEVEAQSCGGIGDPTIALEYTFTLTLCMYVYMRIYI